MRNSTQRTQSKKTRKLALAKETLLALTLSAEQLRMVASGSDDGGTDDDGGGSRPGPCYDQLQRNMAVRR
jgi:hypothetical protein